MNKIFSPSRFARYFVYDLNSARNNYLVSLLIMGFLPVIFFFASQLFSLIFTKQAFVFDSGSRYAVMLLAMIVVVISFPVKVYGGITEKNTGSDWIMLPASITEKWLSMILVTCFVLPVCTIGLLLAGDFLLSEFFPGAYGSGVSLGDFIESSMSNMNDNGFPIHFNFPVIFCVNWCENALIFSLGAIIFKKGKIGKTILSVMVLSTIVMFLTVLVLGHGGQITNDMFENWLREFNPENAAKILNSIISAVYTIIFALLLGGLWVRIKTIKH